LDVLRAAVGRDPVDRDVREEVVSLAAPVGELPAISNSSAWSGDRILSVQSLI